MRVSNLDVELAGLCRDDRCPRLDIHRIHFALPAHERGRKRKRPNWPMIVRIDDSVWVGSSDQPSKSALLPCVWAAVSTRECRTAHGIYQVVLNDFGSITLRNVQRALRTLVVDRQAVYCTPWQAHVGEIPPYRGTGGYLRATSPLLKDFAVVREQITDLIAAGGKAKAL